MTSTSRSPRFATLVFGALFIYLVAVLFHLPNLFYMTAALVVAPGISVMLAKLGLRQVVAERRLPSRLWPDERVEVELRLENTSLIPKCLLRVDEELPPGLEGDPRDPPGAVVPILWGDPAVHRYPITARKRGRYELPGVVTTALDTFALYHAKSQQGPSNEVVVYPRRVPLQAHGLHGPSFDGVVKRRRPVASGTDFRGTREYLPGDDLRRVHWRSTARRNKPIVLEFDEPATLDMVMVLDRDPGPIYGVPGDDTFETGVTLAASLVEHELDHGNAVALILDQADAGEIRLTRERHDLLRFFERLALTEPDPETDFPDLSRRVASAAPAQAILLLISGRLDERFLEVLRRIAQDRPVSYAWLDPAGYPEGGEAIDPTSFLERAKMAGASCFRIRREAISAGVARAV